jgi:hypothetical protein
MAAAGASLGALLPLERRLRQRPLPRPARRVALGAVALLAAGAIIVAVSLGPDAVRSVRADLKGSSADETQLTRSRLTDAGDLGHQTRLQYWDVSLDDFADHPILGSGVGTFARRWAKDRPTTENVTEGHSIYIETLGELGLVGECLILVLLGLLFGSFWARWLDGERALGAMAVAACSTWLVHAGLDWDWELPALTVWLFALGGCALAASPARLGGWTPSPIVRAVAAGLCLLAAVTPATVAISQSRLDGSVKALLRGDCETAQRLAADASSILAVRAEPYEVLSYCLSRERRNRQAVVMMKRAIARDPHDWELLYGLALVRAAGGEDPRGAARTALKLNPREPLAQEVVARFAHGGPRSWRRAGRSAPLPFS